MDYYFDNIVTNLTFNDMAVLTTLSDKEADAVFKAISYSIINKEANLTTFQLKKTLMRLEALKFIEILSTEKQHKVFITAYGYLALNKNLEGVES